MSPTRSRPDSMNVIFYGIYPAENHIVGIEVTGPA
jgi:hypothetical protein